MFAYDKGYIQAAEVKSCLDLMIANAIRLDKKIYNIVMEHVGFV